jgi:alpha-beta hydrolase superfamily lysophospholipase
MIPMHFGSAPERLFGVYHAPTAGVIRQTGVVVCAPFGHEYIRAHRSLRQLAVRLADSGYHVLRFDYYGCGDSDGNGEDASLERWLRDIDAAATELKDTAQLRRLCLVGLRLGATMAAEVSRRRADVDATILWDPIVDGGAYLRSLQRLQRRWLRGRPGSHLFAFLPHASELIGFPLPPALRQSLQDFVLQTENGSSARQIVLADPAHDWDVPELVHTALLHPDMVQRVAAAVEERVS